MTPTAVPNETTNDTGASTASDTENIGDNFEMDYEGRLQHKKRSKRPIAPKWQKNEAKRLRSEGEAYLGYRRADKKVYHDAPRSAWKLGAPCSSVECIRRKNRQCSEITQDQRKKIFTVFWKQTNWDQRKTFVVNHVELKEKIKTYTENQSR